MEARIYEKEKIRLHVKALIQNKILTLERYIAFTKEAASEIKKSPSFDTMREEAHEEIYHLERQLHELKKLHIGMNTVLNRKTEQAQRGSLVITNKARFYISVSFGQFFYEGFRMYAISEHSPMAQKMLGKKAGDDFILNNIHQRIEVII